MDRTQGCPFNYHGGKYRYIDTILDNLPKDKDLNFLDVFAGGHCVSSHVDRSWNITTNELCYQVSDMVSTIYNDKFIFEILVLSGQETLNLFRDNKEAYLDLVESYNKRPTPYKLYLLICGSFSNQIRFNSKNEFNLPFGKRYFNSSMQKKLTNFIERLSERNIEFSSKCFTELDFDDYDILFVDPPYLLTTASYNENGGWTEELEQQLYRKLSNTSSKWMLTNQLHAKGKTNKYLLDFIESNNFTVQDLATTTRYSNYQRQSGDKITEILVTNY